MKRETYDPDGVLVSVEDVPDLPAAPAVDVVALAAELTDQRARLDAAEDALDHLIVASLEGDL